MKNKIGIIFLVLILIFSLSACKKEELVTAEPELEKVTEEVAEEDVDEIEKIDIKLGAPAGSPLLSAIKMFGENTQLEGANLSYEIIKSPDKIPAMIINEELDMAIIPTNLTAILYNKGVPYELVSSNIFGVMYMVSDDTVEINSFEDLKGKEINTMGRNLTPDITLRYLLKNHGINPDEDLTLNYLGGASDLAPAFISGKASISIMPEPVLSLVKSKKENVNVIFDIQKEWSQITGIEGGYPQASLFVKKDIIENHKDVLEEFLNKYKESCNWVNENALEAGKYYETINPGMPGEIISKSVPGNNIDFIYADDGKAQIEGYLNVLFDYNPKTIGGKLPDEGFYYKK